MINSNRKRSNDKLLFTPGPLTTSQNVKEAAMFDIGSRDSEFISIVARIRQKLLAMAHVSSPDYEAVIIQGSGTYGIESVVSSVVPSDGKLLNIVNGAYGIRISQIAHIYSIPVTELVYEENQPPDLNDINNVLQNDFSITHIAIVHCETTTGLINPIAEVGEIASNFRKSYIVDAMSTFGAYEIDLNKLFISYLVSSSNKCIEGIPGFSYILAKASELTKSKYISRTLSLDLYEQWKGLNSNGQFRFTPPVQSMLAFEEALKQLEEEGGVTARTNRYIENNRILVDGMKRIGFKVYLPDYLRGYIITSFMYPSDPRFSFETFYKLLNERGFVIYPGKLSKIDCFRIGNIGQLFVKDITSLLENIEEIIKEMKISIK